MSNANVSLEQFGYQQELKRVLSFKDILIFGIVFICPIAPFSIYGIVTGMTHGHMALTYLIGMFAMIFTAYSYGRMAGEFPVAGSTYTYTQRAINPHVGFITGWMMFLDYVLIPLQINIVGAVYAQALLPSVPKWIFIILFATMISAANYFGVQVTAKINKAVIVIMFGTLIAFLMASVYALTHGVGAGTLFSLKPFYNPETFSMAAVMSGVGIAALSFLGFDAITTLSEEAINPGKDIGRAAILTCIFGATLFIIQAYFATLIWPDYTTFANLDSAFLEIATTVGGTFFSLFCSIVFIVAVLSGGVVGQAGASRLLYGMGRDGVIPNKVFGTLHPKYKTPVNNILIMYVLSIVGGMMMDLALASELVCFGAFVGFMLVNLSTFMRFYVTKKERGLTGFIRNLILPLTGFSICFYIWINMSLTAKTVGFSWLAFGIVYAAITTKGFKKLPPTLTELQNA